MKHCHQMTDLEFAHLEAELFDEYPLPLQGLNGARHWRRVDSYGRLLASASGADLDVVRRFALFHDSQRFCHGHDENHGVRGADLARRYCSEELRPDQMQKLYLACASHERGLCSDDPTIGTCWDADRLDHDRLGLEPDSTLMSTPMGRRLAELELPDRLKQAGLRAWLDPRSSG